VPLEAYQAAKEIDANLTSQADKDLLHRLLYDPRMRRVWRAVSRSKKDDQLGEFFRRVYIEATAYAHAMPWDRAEMDQNRSDWTDVIDTLSDFAAVLPWLVRHNPDGTTVPITRHTRDAAILGAAAEILREFRSDVDLLTGGMQRLPRKRDPRATIFNEVVLGLTEKFFGARLNTAAAIITNVALDLSEQNSVSPDAKRKRKPKPHTGLKVVKTAS
jgi:hypothetical protein